MKLLQPVLLATMISGAVFLLFGSNGTGRHAEDHWEMNRTYAYEGSTRIVLPSEDQAEMNRTYAYEGSNGKPSSSPAAQTTRSSGSTTAGQPAADPSSSPAAQTIRSSGSTTIYNAGAGYRGRPQNPLRIVNTMQINPHHSRIIQSTLQPIDLTINPTETPDYSSHHASE